MLEGRLTNGDTARVTLDGDKVVVEPIKAATPAETTTEPAAETTTDSE